MLVAAAEAALVPRLPCPRRCRRRRARRRHCPMPLRLRCPRQLLLFRLPLSADDGRRRRLLGLHLHPQGRRYRRSRHSRKHCPRPHRRLQLRQPPSACLTIQEATHPYAHLHDRPPSRRRLAHRCPASPDPCAAPVPVSSAAVTRAPFAGLPPSVAASSARALVVTSSKECAPPTAPLPSPNVPSSPATLRTTSASPSATSSPITPHSSAALAPLGRQTCHLLSSACLNMGKARNLARRPPVTHPRVRQPRLQ